MKILHFILGKANPDRANGVNQVINGLAKYLNKQDVEVIVLGISKTNSGKVEIFPREGFQVEVHPSFFNGGLERLKQLASEVDIVHLHGVWNHYNIIFGRYLRKINKPYVVTPHCGLAEDRLKQSNYFTKKLYHKLFQKPLFDGASAIHAITREEMTDIAKCCDNAMFFVPNGVDVENYAYSYKRGSDTKIKIGYLGRLSIEKNIDNLIIAISTLPDKMKENLELFLIGPKDDKAEYFQKLSKQLGLESIIVFTGGLYNDAKVDFLSKLDFYIHPAYSDVVSIAAMEAMAIGLPMVITRTSQVSYYYNSGAFVMVEPIANDLGRGIMEMINRKKEWGELSGRSRKLIENTFNWDSSAQKMIQNYNEIVNHNGTCLG